MADTASCKRITRSRNCLVYFSPAPVTGIPHVRHTPKFVSCKLIDTLACFQNRRGLKHAIHQLLSLKAAVSLALFCSSLSALAGYQLCQQVVRGGSDLRQVLVPRHSPTASDGAQQSQHQVTRNGPSPSRRSASPPSSARPVRGERWARVGSPLHSKSVYEDQISVA